MKILCAFNLYYYRTPEINSSYFFFVDTLLNMGHEVQILDFGTLNVTGGNVLVSRMLVEQVYNFRPDILFTVPYRNEIPRWLIRWITKHTNTITLAWNSDDDRRWDDYSSTFISAYDYMVTTYRSVWERAKRHNLLLSQWACNPRFHMAVEVEKRYDCSFIGIAYHNRPQYIKRLIKEGVNVCVGGRGWDKHLDNALQVVSQAENMLITNQSKISLVFSSGPDGSSRQIKGRVFESPAYRVCTFIENTPGIEGYYEVGKEIVIFHNEDDLVEKVRYYLDHDKEREAIALRGYARTIREHTYELRLAGVLSKLTKVKKHAGLGVSLSGIIVRVVLAFIPLRRRLNGIFRS